MGTDLPVPPLSQRGTNAVHINVNTSSFRLRHLLPYIPNLYAQQMLSGYLNTQQHASFSIQTRRKTSRIRSWTPALSPVTIAVINYPHLYRRSLNKERKQRLLLGWGGGHQLQLHYYPPVALRPTRAMASSFLRFLDHTQRRTTVGRTPLDEWSARRRDFYLTTHNTHNKHPCPRWDSNTRSQQASGRSLTL